MNTEIQEIAESMFNTRDMEGIMNFIFPESQEILGFPNDGPEQKEMFKSFLKKYCIEKKITHFYMLSEAYTSKAEEGMMPIDNPNREEVFVISHIQQGKTSVQLASIHNAGSSRFLGEWKEETENAHSMWEQVL